MYESQISYDDLLLVVGKNKTINSDTTKCTLDTATLASAQVALAVDIFYTAGGLISLFGIALNLLCLYTVRKSQVYAHTCLGFYLQIICAIDSLKLCAEYQLRILIMILPASHKLAHCNLRLGAIMITENLSYVYSIALAVDRCLRIWRPYWAKRRLKLSTVRCWIVTASALVVVYCHPHFYPVEHCRLVIYPSGYYTRCIYVDCIVLSNKLNKYISFPFYWNHVESWVNSFVLPSILVGLNIMLSLGLYHKCRTTNSSLTAAAASTCYPNRRSTVVNKFCHFKLKRKKSLLKATKEASVLVLFDSLLFLITITPVNAFTYFYDTANNIERLNTKTSFSLIGLTFSLVNHAFNGIVFVCCSKTFRGELAKVIFGCKKLTETTSNNCSGYLSRNSMTCRMELMTAKTFKFHNNNNNNHESSSKKTKIRLESAN